MNETGGRRSDKRNNSHARRARQHSPPVSPELSAAGFPPIPQRIPTAAEEELVFDVGGQREGYSTRVKYIKRSTDCSYDDLESEDEDEDESHRSNLNSLELEERGGKRFGAGLEQLQQQQLPLRLMEKASSALLLDYFEDETARGDQRLKPGSGRGVK